MECTPWLPLPVSAITGLLAFGLNIRLPQLSVISGLDWTNGMDYWNGAKELTIYTEELV